MKFRNVLLVSAAVLLSSSSIWASTIAHTWVSGSGKDSNPCTFASPCLTFTGALGNTTAGGIVTVKDAGDFGAFSIIDSVTIDGNNLGSITFNNTIGAGINIISGANVTIENLTINGLGTGNYGITGNGGILTVDNCRIMNTTIAGIFFQSQGNLTVESSRIESLTGTSGIGIKIEGNGAENVVIRNTVIDASPLASTNSGFVISAGAGPIMASLQNVTVMGAGSLAVSSSSGVTEITGSVLTQSNTAVYAHSGATISVASSLITSNTTGVCSNPVSKIRLDNNDIYDNTTAISDCGGTVKTSTTNKTSGTIAIPASDVSDSVTF